MLNIMNMFPKDPYQDINVYYQVSAMVDILNNIFTYMKPYGLMDTSTRMSLIRNSCPFPYNFNSFCQIKDRQAIRLIKDEYQKDRDIRYIPITR